MMNFVAVREDNCYYVNKTHYISLIERANKFFFLIRFRRFGKSLTLSSCYGTIIYQGMEMVVCEEKCQEKCPYTLVQEHLSS